MCLLLVLAWESSLESKLPVPHALTTLGGMRSFKPMADGTGHWSHTPRKGQFWPSAWAVWDPCPTGWVLEAYRKLSRNLHFTDVTTQNPC